MGAIHTRLKETKGGTHSRNGIYGTRRPRPPGQSALMPVKLHHLATLLGFVDDQLAKVGGRPGEHCAAHVRKPRLQLRVGEGRVETSVLKAEHPRFTHLIVPAEAAFLEHYAI